MVTGEESAAVSGGEPAVHTRRVERTKENAASWTANNTQELLDAEFVQQRSYALFDTLVSEVYPLSLRIQIRREANGSRAGGHRPVASVMYKYREVFNAVSAKHGLLPIPQHAVV